MTRFIGWSKESNLLYQLLKKLDRILKKIAQIESGGGGGVQSVTGNLIDNTDPLNPVANAASAISSDANNAAVLGSDDKVFVPQSSGSSSPQIPISMLAEGDNDFVVMASIIARPTGTVANGSPIVWEILENGSSHGSSFIRSIINVPSTASINLKYPSVKNVLSFITSNDESYQKRGFFWGQSVGQNSANIFATFNFNVGYRLQGNGTNWTVSGSFTNAYSLFSYSSGLTKINAPSSDLFYSVDASAVNVTYNGANNYRIERIYSGLGGSWNIGFYLIDIDTNTRVTTAPTALDFIHISNYGMIQQSINLSSWSTTNPYLGNAFMSGPTFNFWTIGMFEVWMKAMPISDTQMKIIWQPKSGVTTYKLNRATTFTVDANGDYVLTTPTEVYSGTDLEFTDTGLTPDTMYYYQLLDQTDTEITQFNAKTKR